MYNGVRDSDFWGPAVGLVYAVVLWRNRFMKTYRCAPGSENTEEGAYVRARV